MILITTFDCRGSPWWQLDLSRCINFKGPFAGGAVVIGFIIDFSSDIILIAAPLYMLRNIAFPSAQRILILVLFSSSVMTLLASVLYCGLYFGASRSGPDSRLLYTMMGHLQVSISLLACNLLVVVMLIYNQVRRWFYLPRPLREPPLGTHQTTTTLGFEDSRPTDPESRSLSTLTLTSISEHSGSYANSTNQEVPSNEVTELHHWLAAKSGKSTNPGPLP
ncbi:hypothetical protein GALMADRAFT_140205 [Galerina marginata CBS 339.88]|uniref:Integral membrane protein n=1 Tax=Galerina marginata (strain CBS 339.88) TaxID=685588 RepID=A0A067SXA9_GALM3|nr:hypothetical protein GALMADRAFT_140205 [Galerina marginata CBS 339.88]